tara:strand:- start:1211 stop:1594 length:384 start_codon:yes stop_codon:yes gene_type:complete
MKKLIITEHTNTTPNISLDYCSGLLKIKGNSFSFDSKTFWMGVMDKIGELMSYIETIEIELNHVSSNSIPYILKLINFNYININWVYDELDEDMYNLGEDLESITKSTFNFYPVVTEFSFNSTEFCV